MDIQYYYNIYYLPFSNNAYQRYKGVKSIIQN